MANTVYSKKSVQWFKKVQCYLQTPPNRWFDFLGINKLKTKYIVLAQRKTESLLLSTALLAIY